jgi:hypothetical protein
MTNAASSSAVRPAAAGCRPSTLDKPLTVRKPGSHSQVHRPGKLANGPGVKVLSGAGMPSLLRAAPPIANPSSILSCARQQREASVCGRACVASASEWSCREEDAHALDEAVRALPHAAKVAHEGYNQVAFHVALRVALRSRDSVCVSTSTRVRASAAQAPAQTCRNGFQAGGRKLDLHQRHAVVQRGLLVDAGNRQRSGSCEYRSRYGWRASATCCAKPRRACSDACTCSVISL